MNRAKVVLILCAALLGFGLVELLALRFESGDVYPEYSTLRADPLGVMAFYESLEGLAGFTVQRDYTTTNQLPDGGGTTYFHIATDVNGIEALPDALISEIERFAMAGGRFVMTVKHGSIPVGLTDPNKRNRWALNFAIVPSVGLIEVQNTSGLELPPTLSWNNELVLRLADKPDWKPIYKRGDDAVIVERNIGAGSIVIATDSYYLSNEAMWGDRQAGLLAWLIGANRKVMFDEAHLGVTERPGVASLMRKYRLVWFLASLALLAGLFIWKNSMSLAPPHSDEMQAGYITGKDAAAGFDNLLRRSIPVNELFATCFTEWKKCAPQTGKYSRSRVQQAEDAFAKAADPVLAYQTISKILGTQNK